MTEAPAPVPVGTRVLYHGRAAVIRAHNNPEQRQDLPADVIAREYPDGTGYELWPEEVPFKFGNRDLATYYVRRKSFTVITEGEG